MSQEAPAGGLRYAARALAHRDFRVFWLGALASNTGTWLANLAVPYVLFQLTHEAVWVGLASVAQLLPGVLLGPWGGSLADRHDRRAILLLTQGGLALGSLAMWLAWVAGMASPGVIMALLVATSLLVGVNMPAWQSFVNDLVPRADVGSAVALNSLQFNASRALGPAIAGGILALAGPGPAFAVDAASFLGVLLALAVVPRRTAPGAAGVRGGVVSEFAGALRYVAGQRGIQMAIVISMLIGLLGNPIFTFTVVFAGDVFHVGPIGLAAMNVTLGVGCILAAPLVSGGLPGLRLGRLCALALPTYGAALAAFALSPSLGIGLVLLVIVGIGHTALLSSANTAIQLIVAGPMRGRVIAVRLVVFSTCLPLGSLLQGWLADLIGPRETVVGAGVAVLVAAAALCGLDRSRWLHRLDDPYDDRSLDVGPLPEPDLAT